MVWNIFVFFFGSAGKFIIPNGFHIFQKGIFNHQPDELWKITTWLVTLYWLTVNWIVNIFPTTNHCIDHSWTLLTVKSYHMAYAILLTCTCGASWPPGPNGLVVSGRRGEFGGDAARRRVGDSEPPEPAQLGGERSIEPGAFLELLFRVNKPCRWCVCDCLSPVMFFRSVTHLAVHLGSLL